MAYDTSYFWRVNQTFFNLLELIENVERSSGWRRMDAYNVFKIANKRLWLKVFTRDY